jgi:organic radical activating enzyme
MVNKELVEIRSETPIFQLTWVVNNICTNHCRYCPEMLHKGKNHHYEWEHAERFAKAVMAVHPKMQVAISGGEPTVSPFLKDLINLFLKKGHTVGLTSNGVREGHYWQDCRPDYICLSYHAEFADDTWITRALDTQARIPLTTARIMMDPIHWDRCVDVYNRLQNTSLGVEAVRILDWGGKSKKVLYTPEQLQWLDSTKYKDAAPRRGHIYKKHHTAEAVGIDGSVTEAAGGWANSLISRQMNYFTGWECDIGLQSMFVQVDGSYRRGNCSQGGYIGWIQDPPQLPTKPVICELHHCHCTTDIMTPKRLIPIYADQ